MKYILPIFLILFGCATEKRCAQKYPVEPETIIIVKDTTIYKDTTLFVKIEGDTVYVEKPWVDTTIWIDERPKPIDIAPISAYVPLAYSKAWVEANILKMRLIQRDSILKFKIDSAIRMHSDTTIVEITVPEKIFIKEKTFWKHGFLVLAGLIIVLALLYFIFKRK